MEHTATPGAAVQHRFFFAVEHISHACNVLDKMHKRDARVHTAACMQCVRAGACAAAMSIRLKKLTILFSMYMFLYYI